MFLYPGLSLSLRSHVELLRVLTYEYVHHLEKGESGHDLFFFLVLSNISNKRKLMMRMM